MNNFYDEISPFYHLIYPDWEASIARQAQQLAGLINERWGPDAKSVLDVSCGIGTQSLGLATIGFEVTGSDLSPLAIVRAAQEAKKRGLEIPFSVCDMRELEAHHPEGFDIVLSADNSVPHLLNDDEILSALRSMHSRLRAGGGCIITMRPYDQIERGRGLFVPFGVRDSGDTRYMIWQVWDFDGDHYALSMYFLNENLCSGNIETRVMHSRYYAIAPEHLMSLMQKAGFRDLARIDDIFFQPVLVGTKRN